MNIPEGSGVGLRLSAPSFLVIQMVKDLASVATRVPRRAVMETASGDHRFPHCSNLDTRISIPRKKR